MNKVKGPLAKKPMGSAKRNQGGPRKWSNNKVSNFTTTAVVATSPHPKGKSRKVRHGL